MGYAFGIELTNLDLMQGLMQGHKDFPTNISSGDVKRYNHFGKEVNSFFGKEVNSKTLLS